MSTPEKPYKILITTDLYTTATNGVVTSVKNLYDELKRKGHDVKILTFSENVHSRREGDITFIRSMSLQWVYPNVRMPLSYRHKLIKDIIDWKPDIIHSQCEFFSFQYAARISRLTGAPIVHTYHTLYEQYATYVVPSKRLGKKLVRFISRERLKKVHTVVAPTAKVEHTLHSYGLKNHISIVPSGIRLDQHKQRLSQQQRLEKRRALGIRDGDLVMLNLGRLGTEKNLPELLDLFCQARTQNDHLVFLIVGDGPAREELEKLAKKKNVAQYVIFTGMVAPGEVHHYYQLGDVFVSASTSETQGLTYIEAAANGLPLLCRQDDCLDEVLCVGENGYDYTNSDEFLQGLDAVMNPEWRSCAGRRSQQIAAGFDKQVFGNAIEAIYDSALQ